MTINKFKALLERGISLDHIFILENSGSVKELGMYKGAALTQFLFRKGFMDGEGGVTEQGKFLLEFAHNEEIKEIERVAKPKILEGIEGLHDKLEAKLVELTGNRQMRPEIMGKKYSFLCNSQDLMARVKKVMVKYKLSDIQAIESSLVRHIEKCHRTKKWYPLIEYFIIKTQEGVEKSQMVTDIKNFSAGELQNKQLEQKDFEI